MKPPNEEKEGFEGILQHLCNIAACLTLSSLASHKYMIQLLLFLAATSHPTTFLLNYLVLISPTRLIIQHPSVLPPHLMVFTHSLLSFLHICISPASCIGLLTSLSSSRPPSHCPAGHRSHHLSKALLVLQFLTFPFKHWSYPAGVSLLKSQFQWWSPATTLSQSAWCTSFLLLQPLVLSAFIYH